MNKIFYVSIFVLLSILIGCSPDKASDANTSTIFRSSEESNFRHLFPHNVGDDISHRITNSIYEGLVSFDVKDLSIQPLLATGYRVSNEGKRYAFGIREGVYFHDDPCFKGEKRELVPEDFVYSFNLLMNGKVPSNGYVFFIDYIKGAKDHFEKTKRGEKSQLEGISVQNDSLVIDLEIPFSDFMGLLAMQYAWVVPHEAVSAYGVDGMRAKTVGTGPFYLYKVVENQTVLMKKNPNYWMKDEQGRQLPLIDGLKVSFIEDLKTALLEFKKGNLDIMYRLPKETIEEVFDENLKPRPDYAKFQVDITPQLSLEYYGFQHKLKPFNNKKLRQAFNYAIDREKLVKYINKGLSEPCRHGVVPQAMKGPSGYDPSKVKGFEYNPELARKLLAEAGYPNGRGLEAVTLQVNFGGGRNILMAEAILKQLEEVLNVTIQYTPLQKAEHYDVVEHGKATFFRSGWMADYPSPENFLRLWYGESVPPTLKEKSYTNQTRYQNPKFDEAFEKAISATTQADKQKYYQIAEQYLIDDAVAIPLYFDKEVRMLQPYVKGLPANSMEMRDMRNVYFDK